MCLALMGPNASETMAGKALMRGLQRAIRDMPEDELRANLTDIRDRLDTALTIPHTVPMSDIQPIAGAFEWSDASDDIAAFTAGE